MAAQLDYGYSTPKGVAGGKVNLFHDEVITRMNEEENGVLKFGMAVMVGSKAGHTCKVAKGATAEQIEGIALCNPTTEFDMNGNVVVKKGASIGVMKTGAIWARLATDVTPTYGAKAYVVVSGNDAGTFTTTASGNVDIGAKFGNETDDGIAIVIF